MNTLALQQQALLQALFAHPARVHPADGNRPGTGSGLLTGARGLQAYLANAHALAARSLQTVYPVMAQLLGGDDFALLARDFWHQHPPLRGDLAQWGDALPAFLHGNTQLAGEPYLGDVARVEWALHQAAHAADGGPDPASFALLSDHAPETLTLVLASGVALVHSAYPVASILGAHLEGKPSLEQAGRRLRARTGESALVWRQGFRPRVAHATAQEAALVQALQSGADLLCALGQAGDLAFDLWLPQAVQSGLVLGAGLLPARITSPGTLQLPTTVAGVTMAAWCDAGQ